MRFRRAVPKIPAKSSVPPRLPLYKNRPLRTSSKSTLPQLLISLHFKSCVSNVYKKPQGEGPISTPKVLQLVTTRSPLLFTPCAVCEGQPARTATPANPFPSSTYFTVLWIPPGGGYTPPLLCGDSGHSASLHPEERRERSPVVAPHLFRTPNEVK
jgi:hypothetical protein